MLFVRSAESPAPPNKFGGGEDARTVDVRARFSREELDRAHTSAEFARWGDDFALVVGVPQPIGDPIRGNESSQQVL